MFSVNPYGPQRSCRIFWCYECQRSVRIISSPSYPVTFCPRCFGQFMHELHLHPSPHRAFMHPMFPPPPPPPPPPPHPRVVPTRPANSLPAVTPDSTARQTGEYFTGPSLQQLIEDLTQNDRPGLPPAPTSAIDSLPTVTITDGHLSGESQCPVCKEDFERGEAARELPCKHLYHSHCIVPWLKIHNSCPVCRFQLPDSSAGSSRSGSAGGQGATRGRVGGGGSSRRMEQSNWNPFPSLWSTRAYGGRGRADWEEEDPLHNPSAFYAWWRSWFLL